LLGRDADLVGQLGSDAQLSRRHAHIATDGRGHMILEDLGSSNGTLLNGVRVTGRQRIYVSDIIEVGGSRLQLLDADSSPPVAARAPEASPGYDEPLSSAWAAYEPVPGTAPAPTQPPPLPPPRPAASGERARRIPHEDVAPARRGVRPPHLTRRGKAAVGLGLGMDVPDRTLRQRRKPPAPNCRADACGRFRGVVE
jgi:hypothetical protein